MNLSVKSKIIPAIAIVLLILAGPAAYYGSALWIKTIGIEVKPGKAYEPQKTQFFLQNDPQWKDNLIGQSGLRLGGYGCLVSALTSSISQLGHETTPRELNDLFARNGVYTAGGEVIWYKISEVIPGIKYQYKRVFSSSTLEEDLRQRRLPIVKVRYKRTGVFHWVLVVGADKEDFLIMDPLNPNKEVVSLGTHGKVHAYRVLQKTEEMR